MNNNDDPNTIFVGGLNVKADENSLKQFFESNFGEVSRCKLIFDHFTQRSKGYGFVTFKDEEVAKKVVNSDNLFFMGKMMNVGPAVRKSVKKKKQQPFMSGYQMPPIGVGVPQQPYYYFPQQPFISGPVYGHWNTPPLGYQYPYPYPDINQQPQQEQDFYQSYSNT